MKILNQNILGKLLQRAMSISERQTPDVDLHYCGFLKGTEIHVRVFPSGWTTDAGWWESTIEGEADALNLLEGLRKLELNGVTSDWRSPAKWREVK